MRGLWNLLAVALLGGAGVLLWAWCGDYPARELFDHMRGALYGVLMIVLALIILRMANRRRWTPSE